jgi:hypothetical protein
MIKCYDVTIKILHKKHLPSILKKNNIENLLVPFFEPDKDINEIIKRMVQYAPESENICYCFYENNEWGFVCFKDDEV